METQYPALGAIGHTPLVQLQRIVPAGSARVLIKLESANPTGSMKDRVAKAMVQALQDHPELQGLRRWMLATSDAHGVYEALGWQPLAQPELFMQRHDPDVYRRGTA